MGDSIHIIKPVIRMIHILHKIFDGKLIFCGSFGLVYNGVLNRPIGDIDVITEINYYSGLHAWNNGVNELERKDSDSGIFAFDNIVVKCFGLHHISDKSLPSADIMFITNHVHVEYDIINFYGIDIKIEKPAGAMIAKKEYVDSSQLKNRQKHIDDMGKFGEFGDWPSPESRDDIPF